MRAPFTTGPARRARKLRACGRYNRHRSPSKLAHQHRRRQVLGRASTIVWQAER